MEALATSFSSPATSAGGRQGLRQQAEEMESVFLNTLVSEMFKGVGEENAFGGGFATQTWRSMQSEQFAAAMARGGGIGLADQIMQSLLHTQEAASGGTHSPRPSKE